MKVWTLKDAVGQVIGLFYFDPFARDGKRSGAWMSELRSEEHFDGQVLPLVVNVTNFTKPAAGEPAVLSLDAFRGARSQDRRLAAQSRLRLTDS